MSGGGAAVRDKRKGGYEERRKEKPQILQTGNLGRPRIIMDTIVSKENCRVG